MPKHKYLKCFFDNCFTSIGLLRELKSEGIPATGTIRANRLMGCSLEFKEELKKEGRGAMDTRITEDVVLIRWLDNGVVNIASTEVGTGEVGVVKMY